MVTPSIDITYAAHTASCTFLLDSEGICRRIVMKPKGKRRESARTASRCVGAQYVASLDGSAAGGLVEMPRVGAAMLFARVDERGRISLVRTGVVVAFESHAGEDPFLDSRSVETSAPDLLTPRMVEEVAAEVAREQALHLPEPQDPDYDDDPGARTQRIPALRPEELAAAFGHDLATAEYHAVAEAPPPRASHASNAGPMATLRNPHHEAGLDDDEDDYAHPTLVPPPAAPPPSSRGMLPRRSDPNMRVARAQAADPRPAPRAYASDIQVSRRRRG